ncbi:MAG: ABC transporter permease [Candidatus Eremiobacteraeota bacterium]|nr:ABC transporter permease [Candidatus Eremiobacteraeota bacterium]
MDWGKVRFFWGEVWRNFTRNAAMQLTAIGTVTVTVVLLGGFLYVRTTLAAVGDDMLHRIEISVFLKDGTTAQAAQALRSRIAHDHRVASVTFISKAEGLRQMRQQLKGQMDTSLLTSNPLPDALRVKAGRPDDVPAVAAHIPKLPDVATVSYAQDAVQRALRVGEVLARIGLGVVALLVFVAAIIISNTIRLTVFARRREIAIMQLVGATNTYIRMPFICEGIIEGVLGALVAIGLLAAAEHQLIPKLITALPFVPLNGNSANEALLALELLATGAAVGAVASWFSVGRYLRT